VNLNEKGFICTILLVYREHYLRMCSYYVTKISPCSLVYDHFNVSYCFSGQRSGFEGGMGVFTKKYKRGLGRVDASFQCGAS